MTSPHPSSPGADGSRGPDALDRFFDWLRGLGVARRTDDKWVAGVASGLADRLRIDPVVVRAGLVLLTLLFGVGVTIYLVAWAFLPTRSGRISAEQALRHGDGGSIFLLIVTALAVFGGAPWWFDGGGWGIPWAVFMAMGLVWYIVHQKRKQMSPQERQEWQQRASGWGEDAGNRVGAWGDQVGQKASDWGNRVAGGTPDGTPVGAGGAGGAGSAAAVGGSLTTTPQDTPRGRSDQTLATGPTSYDAGQASYGTSPATYGAGPATSVVNAPAPAAPRRRSGGFLMVLIAIGLGLLTFGSAYWAAEAWNLPGSATTIALASTLGALGLLILVLGIAGWRSGFAGFLAVVTAVVLAFSLAVPGLDRFGGQWGDQTWTPDALTTQTTTFELGGGEGVVNLTGIAPSGLDGKTVELSVGAGVMTLIVPADVQVALDAEVGAGEVQVPNGQGGYTTFGGLGIDKSATVGTGTSTLQVNAEVGLGQVILRQEQK